ncbi:YaaA family protein [Sanguibacter sp. A247]|uniref:YaaA family protein n=1 Tax=unclassified Sanguibacter TaxID=2645534 RepID=UPI003FD896BE
MIVLLPPSEGKTAASAGAPLDLDMLVLADLAPERRKVLEALASVSARPDALTVLGVGASLADEVARNTSLELAPTAPAAHVYSGVLYAAADLAGALVDSRASSRTDSVLTVSALWGVVAPNDPIPAYRLSMGTDLPGIGPLARFWREPLRALDERAGGDVVVDCRSTAYAAAYRPRGAEHVTVRVVRELDGRRSVVSHHAKHTRGLLTGHLLRREGEPPTTAAELLEAASELVGDILLEATLTRGASGTATLELVV